MKIVVVASLAYSLINFRRALLADMIKAGHEVIACAPENDEETIRSLQAIGVCYKRVPMERANTNPFGDLMTLGRIFGLLRAERPEVVLAYTQKPIIYAGIASRLYGHCDFYAMVSGLGHVFSDSNRNWVLRIVVSFLYRIGIKHARAVIVFNRDDRAEMMRRGILRADQSVVQVPGSGVDSSYFSARELPKGPPVFLLIARLLRDKGLIEFADAARGVRALCPEARFQILGPLDSNPSGITREELEAWKSEGVVEYLGETRDVRQYLAEATVFVLPTYYREGLPRTIIEAMATGRAIITTDAPGCRETVTHGVNGFLVPVRDADALAAAMMLFVHDPNLAGRMGAQSRAFAEQRFSIEIVNERLLETMKLREPLATRPGNHHRSGAAIRRLIDIVVATAGLVAVSPLLLLLVVCTFATLGTPIFFEQTRVGLGGRPFRMIKLRSMTNARDASGKLLDDRTRTPLFGRLLRRLRLDELPELWNILIGDMSLIGPRPLLYDSAPTLGVGGRERGSMRPGLTGWAQVNGNALLSEDDKLALDLWYIRNASFLLDLTIVAKTIGVLLFGDRINRFEIQKAKRFGGAEG